MNIDNRAALKRMQEEFASYPAELRAMAEPTLLAKVIETFSSFGECVDATVKLMGLSHGDAAAKLSKLRPDMYEQHRKESSL